MRAKHLASALLLVGLSVSQMHAVVGYVNQSFVPGFNVFANLFVTSDPTVNGAFTLGNMVPDAPVGTALTKFNTATGQYLPYSIFDGSTWSINYSLAPGEGAVLFTTDSFTTTFAGELVANPAIPARPSGFFLLGSSGYTDPPGSLGKFQDIIGRAPVEGESISRFDRTTQTFTTYHYMAGDWYDESFTQSYSIQLTIMEAAFFGLGGSGGTSGFLPPPVPEPSSAAIFLSALVLGGGVFRRR